MSTDFAYSIADDYSGVLDHMGRVAQAVETGDWRYLADKAQKLADYAQRLAHTATKAIDAGALPPRHDVMAHTHDLASHYRTFRLLHPQEMPSE